MLGRVYRPGLPLGEFVDCLWYFDAYEANHARERALPTGTVELVINLKAERFRILRDDRDSEGLAFRESVVCGPQSGYFVLDTTKPSTVIGAHFLPGGAAAVLGARADELTDRHVGLEDIWGAQAGSLRERLLEAGSPEKMFAVLERLLISRMRQSLAAHPAAAYALQHLTGAPEISRIGQVQLRTGYSPKRFIELFRNAVGLTPKVYSRIRRFQLVLDRLAKGDRIEWAEVALDGGYCDQSHLNREFLRFAGVTPGGYRPVSPDRPSHVAMEG